MAVDADTVRRIAHLARIAVAEEEIDHLKGELNAMLSFVEQLGEVNVEGVEPMTSVTPMAMKKRADVVTDGGIAGDVIAAAAPGLGFLEPDEARIDAEIERTLYSLTKPRGDLNGMMREADHSTIPGRAPRGPGISCRKTE